MKVKGGHNFIFPLDQVLRPLHVSIMLEAVAKTDDPWNTVHHMGYECALYLMPLANKTVYELNREERMSFEQGNADVSPVVRFFKDRETIMQYVHVIRYFYAFLTRSKIKLSIPFVFFGLIYRSDTQSLSVQSCCHWLNTYFSLLPDQKDHETAKLYFLLFCKFLCTKRFEKRHLLNRVDELEPILPNPKHQPVLWEHMESGSILFDCIIEYVKYECDHYIGVLMPKNSHFKNDNRHILRRSDLEPFFEWIEHNKSVETMNTIRLFKNEKHRQRDPFYFAKRFLWHLLVLRLTDHQHPEDWTIIACQERKPEEEENALSKNEIIPFFENDSDYADYFMGKYKKQKK